MGNRLSVLNLLRLLTKLPDRVKIAAEKIVGKFYTHRTSNKGSCASS
jgi:hypothetical protein